jgi:hypothetical protein
MTAINTREGLAAMRARMAQGSAQSAQEKRLANFRPYPAPDKDGRLSALYAALCGFIVGAAVVALLLRGVVA